MTEASKAFQALSALIRERQTMFEQYSDPSAFLEQPDRGAAILAVADLERALEDALQSKMSPLRPSEVRTLFQGEKAPLASFYDKIWIGFAFGIYRQRTRAELDRLRRIRNAFAHAHRLIRFDTDEVKACCSQLTYTKRLERPHFSQYPLEQPWPPVDAKVRYIETAKALAAALVIYSDGDPDPQYPLD